jgi:protein O-mannosyl-transferase
MKKKKKTERKPQANAPKKQVVTRPSVPGKMNYTPILIILLLTIIAYLPALNAGFVNWDDPDYANNQTLKSMLSDFSLLFTKPIQGNYHPLTMLSLLINYAISGMDAWSYHLFNVLFHLANCYLVYRLAMLLSNKNMIIAFTTSILFAVHPMHVESVAWVAERKDVLYSLFFILGLISYIKYVDTGSKKQYGFTALFLLLSLLSKPAAVIFPIALFCVDLLRKRKFSARMFIEKVPFLLVAFFLGYITFLAQKQTGATQGSEVFDTGTRVLMGFYGIMMYFFKLIFPFNLSALYPFPPLNESLPAAYYLSPVFTVLLAVLFFYSLKRTRIIAFGIFFYVVNLLLILQVLPVGSAIIAERYTYIPYIGIFYVAGWLIDRYAKGNTVKAYYITVPVALILSVLTYRQSSVWFSGATLWDHAIKTQPSAIAYANRAVLFKEEKNDNKAIEYYTKAIEINTAGYEAYTSRGVIYFNQQKFDLAYADFNKALSIKPDYYSAMDNLGALFGLRGQFDSALQYFSRALAVRPDYLPSLKNRGLAYSELNRNQEAINDFEKVLQLNRESSKPDDPDILNIIGSCNNSLGRYQEAISIINKAINLKPDPHFYLNRAYSNKALGNMEAARKDALTAKQGGLQLDPEFAKSLEIE